MKHLMFRKQLRGVTLGILSLSISGIAQDRGSQPPEQVPKVSISATAPMVTLDVSVAFRDGMFIPGLKQQNFRVFEDGVQQTLSSFDQTQGPITALVLVEFAHDDALYNFAYDSLIDSFAFAQSLKKEDRLALITYDIKPHVLQDFTQDKNAIRAALSMVRPGMAGSQEANLFDALYDTLERVEVDKGKKYIILVSSGRDTSSKRTFDQLLDKVQASRDMVIYSLDTAEALRNYSESHGLLSHRCAANDFGCTASLVTADNRMMAFAKMTGGRFYRPLFDHSFRDVVAEIGNNIRNQYTLAYHPTNRAQDGSYRKIKVELVDENGQPLKFHDRQGRDMKYMITAREGYKAVQQTQ